MNIHVLLFEKLNSVWKSIQWVTRRSWLTSNEMLL